MRLLAPILWLAAIALLGMPLTELEFNNDEWLAPDHPVELSLDRLAEEFEPGETTLLVLPLKQNFFGSDELQQQLYRLEAHLKKLDVVTETLSPLSARTVIELPPEDLYEDGEAIQDDETLPPVLEIGSYHRAIQQGSLAPTAKQATGGQANYPEFFQTGPYAGMLLSADAHLAAIQLRLNTRENAAARHNALNKIRAITTELWPGKHWLVGAAAIKDELNTRLRTDILWLLLLAGGGTLLLLRLLLGTWPRALLIAACAGGCLITAMAWLPRLATPFTAPALILPVMIITTATADSLHLLLRWQSYYPNAVSPSAAVWRTFKALWLPCLSASLSTAIGCGAFILSDIVVLSDFSVAAIIGITSAYPLMIVPLLVSLALWPQHFLPAASRQPSGNSRIQRLLLPPIRWVQNAPKRTGVLVLLPCCILAAGLYRLHTESNFLAIFFSPQEEIQQGFRQVDEHLGGSGSVNIILNADDNGHYRTSAALQDTSKLTQLLQVPNVNRVDSYLLPLREVHPRLSDIGEIPRNEAELAQEIFFLELSRREDQRGVLEPYMDFNYASTRLDLHTPDLLSADLGQLIGKLKQQVQNSGITEQEVTFTGFSVFLHSLSELILSTQLESLAWTLGLISIVFLLQFKLLPALLGIFVNLIPLAATAGLISWLSLPYDFGTLLVIGITIGFSVDDTLHFLHYYAHSTGTVRERLGQSIQVTGPAILTAGLVLGFGLSLLLSSSLVLIDRFAFFSVFGLLLSLFCALLLLPALLAILQPASATIPSDAA